MVLTAPCRAGFPAGSAYGRDPCGGSLDTHDLKIAADLILTAELHAVEDAFAPGARSGIVPALALAHSKWPFSWAATEGRGVIAPRGSCRQTILDLYPECFLRPRALTQLPRPPS